MVDFLFGNLYTRPQEQKERPPGWRIFNVLANDPDAHQLDDRLRVVFKQKNLAYEWLTKQNEHLDGRKPEEFVRLGLYEEVLAALNAQHPPDK